MNRFGNWTYQAALALAATIAAGPAHAIFVSPAVMARIEKIETLGKDSAVQCLTALALDNDTKADASVKAERQAALTYYLGVLQERAAKVGLQASNHYVDILAGAEKVMRDEVKKQWPGAAQAKITQEYERSLRLKLDRCPLDPVGEFRRLKAQTKDYMEPGGEFD